MSTETEKAGNGQAVHVPAIVDLRDRVPTLDDKALATLRANALRLKETGNARQQASAEDLLPVIEAELAIRREKKRADAPAKAPRAAKPKKTKAKAKAADAESAEA